MNSGTFTVAPVSILQAWSHRKLCPLYTGTVSTTFSSTLKRDLACDNLHPYHHQLHRLPFLQEFRSISECDCGNWHLLIIFFVHELVACSIVVQIGEFLLSPSAPLPPPRPNDIGSPSARPVLRFRNLAWTNALRLPGVLWIYSSIR